MNKDRLAALVMGILDTFMKSSKLQNCLASRKFARKLAHWVPSAVTRCEDAAGSCEGDDSRQSV
jgi:hypothetical protein